MDLEEMQRKKLEQVQEQAETQRKYELARKQLLMSLLTKDARERLNTVRVAHPELAQNVEVAIVQAIQEGHVRGKIDDTTLKELLTKLRPKKDFRIRRR